MLVHAGISEGQHYVVGYDKTATPVAGDDCGTCVPERFQVGGEAILVGS